MKIVTMVLAAALVCAHSCYSQVITFQKIFGYTDGVGDWYDNAGDVFELSDSSIILISFSYGNTKAKVVTTGFSKNGNQLYENAFGVDSVYHYIGEAGTANRIYKGNFAIAGSGGKNLIDEWATLWIFNSSGDSMLYKEFGSLGNFDTLENFYDIVQLPDSGFMMVGWKELSPILFPIPDINPNLYLLRTDKNGNVIWQKEFDKSFDDQGNHIELFDSSHVIIAGYKHAYNSPNDTPWVFVADLDGNIVKERSFTDPPYNCYYLIGPRLFSSIDGNFFFTGCLNGALYNGGFDYPTFIAKMDTNLDFIWEKDFNSGNLIYIYHAEQMQDSSIMLVGDQIDSINGRVWGWVRKLDSQGNIVWDKLYKKGSSFINYLYDIDPTYDCGFVVSGSNNNGDQQSWLIKMDRYGCIDPVCDTTASSCGAGIPTSVNQSFDIDLLSFDVKLYPNPCDDLLNIFYNLPEQTSTAQFQIFDVNARKIFEQKLTRATHLSTIDVSAYASGVYMCVIRTEREILTREILVGR